MTLSILSLLNHGNYQIYNRDVAKKLGSINAAIFLAEMINRYEYHRDNQELKTFQKHDGAWFFYTVAKGIERLSMSDKEQATAIKKIQPYGLFKAKAIGLPAKRHFQLDIEAIERFVGCSKKDSRTDKFAEVDMRNQENNEREKGTANKEPNEDLPLRSPLEGNEEALPPFKKNGKRKKLDATQQQRVKELVEFTFHDGSKINEETASYWVATYPAIKIDQAFEGYDYERSVGRTVWRPGGYIRSVLDGEINPVTALISDNKETAITFALKNDWKTLEIKEKYVVDKSIFGAGDIPLMLPPETFMKMLNSRLNLKKDMK